MSDQGKLTRRQALKGAAAMGAGLAAAPLLGTPARAATTTTPRLAPPLGGPGDITAVQHVVFLMQENRSFDHIFGTLSGVRGFDDRSITRPDGGNIFEQFDPVTGKYELPFLLSQNNNGQLTPSLSHAWGAQHASLNGGKNDNWLPAHRQADGSNGIFTMGYYTRNEIPYHYALADAFTICDAYHCSVLGPTYPNRLMWQTGSIDPNGTGGGPLLTTDGTIFTANNKNGVFSYETYPERLQAAGVTWKAYGDPYANGNLNMLPALKQYVPTTTASGGVNPLWENGILETTTAAFIADAQAGTLPQVSWIFPTPEETEHPSQGPNTGPTYYGPVIDALMSSVSWSSTVLFLTYDENDGIFDHVPPPAPPVGADLEYLTATPWGGAARRPASSGRSASASGCRPTSSARSRAVAGSARRPSTTRRG